MESNHLSSDLQSDASPLSYTNYLNLNRKTSQYTHLLKGKVLRFSTYPTHLQDNFISPFVRPPYLSGTLTLYIAQFLLTFERTHFLLSRFSYTQQTVTTFIDLFNAVRAHSPLTQVACSIYNLNTICTKHTKFFLYTTQYRRVQYFLLHISHINFDIFNFEIQDQ